MKQSLPLDVKIKMTETRLKDWVDYWGLDNVYVSFSGGKDSTVLLHIARQLFPTIKAMFVDTGLEYPEIRSFVKTFDNVDWVKPKLTFKQVIEKYGYPFISKEVAQKVYEGRSKPDGYTKKYFTPVEQGGKHAKYNMSKYAFLLNAPFTCTHKCCYVMKKSPAHTYYHKTGKHPITAETTEESRLRETNWLLHGCNAFDTKIPVSKPMSFWTEQDILRYIYVNKIELASVYGEVIETEKQIALFDDFQYKYETTGCKRTGCMFCAFGCHRDGTPNRFERMKITHPKQYEYIMKPFSEGGLNYKFVIDWINEHSNLNIKY